MPLTATDRMKKGKNNMTNRPTIEDSSLNDLIQPATDNNGTPIAILNGEKKSPQKKSTGSKKQRITVQISEDVIERIKNAVYWTPGLTLTSLAEDAFSKAVDILEEERRVPFPKRKEELKTGRPIN